MMTEEMKRLVSDLQLTPHPEGGYYRETYRSPTRIMTVDGSRRSAVTNIYFLLTSGMFSAWHRIDADETWHFYFGSDVVIPIITRDGDLEERRLGPKGPWQTTVPTRHYFAAYVPDEAAYALVGCTVAPGFEFSGFELASRAALTTQYPQHAAAILRFTRD
jgi:uncharacterized protein